MTCVATIHESYFISKQRKTTLNIHRKFEMEKVKDAITYGAKKCGYSQVREQQSQVREQQRQVAEAYLSGRDVFMSAPTGSGKSLTFEIAPYAFDFLSSDPYTSVEEGRSVCLVVVPLIALMNDQVVSLTSWGLSVASVGSDCSPEHLSEIKEGKVKLVFGTPEALLNSHRGIFRGPLKMNLKAVFIDESHCIAKW